MHEQEILARISALRTIKSAMDGGEKRAFVGGIGRVGQLLARMVPGVGKGVARYGDDIISGAGKGMSKLLPRAKQMATEMPKSFNAMNPKNMKQMLSSSRMPGMKPPPLPRGRAPGFGLGKGVGGRPLAPPPTSRVGGISNKLFGKGKGVGGQPLAPPPRPSLPRGLGTGGQPLAPPPPRMPFQS